MLARAALIANRDGLLRQLYLMSSNRPIRLEVEVSLPPLGSLCLLLDELIDQLLADHLLRILSQST